MACMQQQQLYFSIPTLVHGITNYSKQFSIHTFHLYDTLTKKVSQKHIIKISEFIFFARILHLARRTILSM